MTPAEAQKALRDAVKAPTPPKKKAGTFTPKKPNPQSTKGKGSKGSNKGLTPAERKEKASLIRENRADQRGTLKQKGDAPGGRQRTLIPVPGSKNRQRIVADPQNRLKGSQQFSKAELENMNPSERLSYELKGMGGEKTTMRPSDKGSMDEQSKKYGGKIKRNMGGPTTPSGPRSIKTYDNTKDAKTHMIRLMAKGQNASTIGDERGSTVVVRPGSLSKSQIESAKKTLNKRTSKPKKKTVFRRGGGQALRGFGKATYSNKMY